MKGMPEQDVFRHENQWKKIENNNLSLGDLSSKNQKIISDFLNDFKSGMNTPKQFKGRRTAGTLLKLRRAVLFFDKHIKKDFEKITKSDFHKLFDKMQIGTIKTEHGSDFKDVGDFVKNAKTFWGWMRKTKRAEIDITEDLSPTSYKRGKPAWVYLEFDQVRKLIDNARGDYRTLILFLYDSGIRPSEAYRLLVSDLQFKDNEVLLTIPERRPNGARVSKTFERTIKLKQSGTLIKNYIEINKLKSTDYLVIPSLPAFNKYLKELSNRLFGSVMTKARAKTDQIKLYDIRHLSAIYWLDKYKTHKDLMYRMGWKKEDRILYYSEFLGRRDKIDDEDMMTMEDKTKLEKDNQELKTKMTIMQTNFERFEKLTPILEILNQNQKVQNLIKKEMEVKVR